MKKLFMLLLCFAFLLPSIATVYANTEEETPSGIPLSEMDSIIDEYIEQYIMNTTPGAAVVVIKDGRIIFSKGYGYSDIEKSIPVDSTSTVFEYGSISKLFVYTTIMSLMEQGKMTLTDDIRSYLPQGFLKKIKYDEPITFIDVMNHTTGFEDYLFDVILTTSKNRPSFEETLVKSQPAQVYEPGSISAYSNYAVGLAAYVTETILGKEFYNHVMEAYLKPLKMDNTSAHPFLTDRTGITNTKANGYMPLPDGSFKPGGSSYVPLYPVGGINGTAEDLAKFAIALMPEEGQPSPFFEKRETLDTMFTETLAMGPGVLGFAHGFMEYDGEYRAVGHGGNTAYFSTQLIIVPEERFGVIILTNAANEKDITLGLSDVLIGKKDKSVVVGVGSMPSSSDVEGSYISARRMANGFLELYSYLMPLTVKAIGENTIELSLAGQTTALIQTRPHVYERTSVNGTIFDYHFSPIYFDVKDGRVERISGDYIPMPPGRTLPWLYASLLITLVGAAYILIALIAIVWSKLIRKSKGKMTGYAQRCTEFMILGNAAITLNTVIIVTRMLSNNYRSFSEFQLQLFINCVLGLIVAALTILSIIYWKKSKLTIGQKLFTTATIVITATFIGTLINWQFFRLFI